METEVQDSWGRGLSVSIVVYRPNVAQLRRTLLSLGEAIAAARARQPDFTVELYVVDNGGTPDISSMLVALTTQNVACRVLAGHGNVGYGRGHNLAIERTDAWCHLVLNPDVDLERESLVRLLDFIGDHPDVGLVIPRIGNEDGSIQYLCRRYPSVFDLFVRGFLPVRWRRLFARRLERYEMRDLINEHDVVWDPQIASGCFMLFRASVLKTLGGFDPRYFLYFEDYDLSMRTHAAARVVYLPFARVLHYGGGASRKGGAHVRMFALSAFRFFNRFGWKWL
ncbi:glycosyl transferase [Burkholderia ubonensis]|uniref:Glycosyl transferase n=1 Tax=Burkholderia ubonensis TaxID=101571 RepID=A0AAW3N009_9BURK|nr:glycosyltransferase family 2 protein [Burkholderia ubonensis]KVL13853.1 glycosyl transferase [Burkholderia ubonensis]KVO10022.1 glycosyl transferase [Burkholderia ubonensis]KVO22234.1 glycosyl transferase [Burkholderia ubonensis]KVO34476.1 glycosyl transferase [Burkholderia ubonensis]KVP63397.1 glycosyl transferase [Burkholderia ubonensis]